MLAATFAVGAVGHDVAVVVEADEQQSLGGLRLDGGQAIQCSEGELLLIDRRRAIRLPFSRIEQVMSLMLRRAETYPGLTMAAACSVNRTITAVGTPA